MKGIAYAEKVPKLYLLAFQRGVFVITSRNSYLFVLFLTPVSLSGLLHKDENIPGLC